MNDRRRTELRTHQDLLDQAKLERMLAARRAGTAARAARASRPTRSRADEENDARWELVIAIVFAAIATPLVAALLPWLLPIIWGRP